MARMKTPQAVRTPVTTAIRTGLVAGHVGSDPAWALRRHNDVGRAVVATLAPTTSIACRTGAAE